MFFSIVVPAYNVEKYLDNCLGSILNQTYKDFEILLIDDESSDNTRIIAESYAGKHEFIRLKTIKNTTVGNVRNEAIKMAVGRYLVFVDADDFIYPDMLEIIHECLIRTDADVCFMPNYITNSNGRKDTCSYIPKKSSNSVDFFSLVSFIEFCMQNGGMIPSSMWNLICRKQVIDDYSITMNAEYIWSEDSDFIFSILTKVDKIALCDYAGYEWNISNTNSLSHQVSAYKIISRMSVYRKWIKLLDEGCFGNISEDATSYIKKRLLKNYFQVLEPYSFLKRAGDRREVIKQFKADKIKITEDLCIPLEYRVFGFVMGRYIYLFNHYICKLTQFIKRK